ncbi:MAG: DUF4118 domain-containing protein [Solobacterium sp.]|nr:DUF4118 domain-containing protein [Solobacterium sp.]
MVQKKEKKTILVCLSASPSNERVIRSASRFYVEGRDTFLALYVGSYEKDVTHDKKLQENIALAKSFGAQIDVMESREITLTISEYAKRSKVTDLFIGSSVPSHILQSKSIPEQLVAFLPEVDIHIIPDAKASAYPQAYKKTNGSVWNIRDFLLVIGIMAIATCLSFWFYHSRFSNSNIITIYILAVLVASVLTSHQLYGIIAAVLYILLFNFLFINPRFTLLVYDPEYMVTYLVTIVAALITGSLAAKLKSIAWESAETAYQAKVLLDTSNQLQKAKDSGEMVRIACVQLSDLLKRDILFYRVDASNNIVLEGMSLQNAGADNIPQPSDIEKEAILWTYENGHHSGAYTSHYADCKYRYLSIYTDDNRYGIIGIRMGDKRLTAFEKTILLSIINEFAMSLDNETMNKQKQVAEINAETERFRSGLLRSVSHDLRTPLTAIYGNAGNLYQNADALSDEEKLKIYYDIQEDAFWLNGQMENILSMTKLENHPDVTLSPMNVDEVIEESLKHLDPHFTEHHIHVQETEESYFALMDAKLIVLVLVNLLNNAIKYTPEGSHIEITKEKIDQLIWISVKDDGNGIPEEDKKQIFALYYTGKHSLSGSCRSMGIGLNLCDMILKAHKQKIEVLDNEPHGAVFRFSLEALEVGSDERFQDLDR